MRRSTVLITLVYILGLKPRFAADKYIYQDSLKFQLRGSMFKSSPPPPPKKKYVFKVTLLAASISCKNCTVLYKFIKMISAFKVFTCKGLEMWL